MENCNHLKKGVGCMESLNITLERRREIDRILKENERKYKNGELNKTPLSEFLEKQKSKREVIDGLIERQGQNES